MRRASHSAARLQLDREHLKLERRRQQEFMKPQFDEWLETEEGKEKLRLGKVRARSPDFHLRKTVGMPPLPLMKGTPPKNQERN